MFALTIDQRKSRSTVDAVPDLLGTLSNRDLVRSFERTAGDEVQGLCRDAEMATDIVIEVAQSQDWWIGIGIGDVEEPLPRSVRASRGSALVAARVAVDRAKRAGAGIAVESGSSETAEAANDTETILQVLGRLISERSAEGREAVEVMRKLPTQAEAARRLGISTQAMSRRLQVAHWREEQRLRALTIRLMSEADTACK